MGRPAWVLGLPVLVGGGPALVWALAPPLPPKPDLPRLQALATESCRCARTKPGESGKRACWAEFEGEAARFDPSRYFTACEPVSPKGYCFGEDLNACVVTEYSSTPGASLCSDDEARIATAAYEEARRRRERGDSIEDPSQAVVAASQALARGEKLAASSRGGGCAG